MDARPWLKNYPTGIPANIDINQYDSLVQFLEKCFDSFAELPAFTCMGKTLKYKEIGQMSAQFGAYLNSRGLEPGDRIALMIEGSDEVEAALDAYRDTIATETLAEQWLAESDCDCFIAEGKADGHRWSIALKVI